MHQRSASCSGLLSLLFTFILTTTATPQISWIRHDINKSLRGGYGLHAVDVNKDGKMDFLSASRDGIRWWRNGGNGSFSGSSVGSLEGAWSAFGADVDDDGDIDVAAASPHPNEQKMLLWFGTGFGTPKDMPLLEAEDVCSADLDGDGIMEIIGVSWAENLPDPGNDLIYYKDYLNGPGTAVTIDPNLSGAHSVTAADFDKDGDIDIIASGDGRINAYRNDGRANFATPKQLSGNGALCVNAYDINGDGTLDLVSQERNPPNQNVYWWQGNGSLGFTKKLVGEQIGESWGVHAGDLDGDGDMDIVAASQTYRTIRAYINDGNESFSEMTVVENFGDAAGVRYAIALDADGDGDDDVIGTTPAGDLAWFESISAASPSIEVTAPNGGEKWTVGTTEEITWSAVNGINNVNIEFSTNGGSNWQPVASNLPNNGSYLWLIPNAISDACRIRVSDAANLQTRDASNGDFAIVAPEFRLTAPNGGENWVVGATRTISWIDNQGLFAQIKIEYSIDDGASWQIINAAANNNGSYRWTIPNTTSNLCRVRISDPSDGDPVDASDATFSITGPRLTMTFPNGGEEFEPGASQNITWTTAGTIDRVNLEFSADGGDTWQIVADNLSNSGSFAWTVPELNSTACLIKVTDAADPSRSDLSDAAFTIGVSSIIVTFPNGGENLLHGGTHTITWTSSGQITHVKIELSRNGGNTWATIASNTSNDGHHNWTISGSTSENCLIRISDVADGNPKDVSDAAFAISTVAITVTTPNGGETWFKEKSESITWTSAGTINQVKIELSRDGGNAWEVLTANTANDGTFNWNASGEVSNNCLVRISDAADGNPADQSNAAFAILAETLTIVAPNGGESLYDTSEFEIQWTTAGPVGSVDLQYSLDNGADWQNIATAITNTGSYLWTVPDTLSDSCRVRIVDAADGAPEDVSDEVFRILRLNQNNPPIAVINATLNAPRQTPINFSAAQSSDADGDSLSYAWEFGDGAMSSGVEVAHAYLTLGEYAVRLTVSDGQGGISIDTAQVTIFNRPPNAEIAVPAFAFIDSVAGFDASASTDADGDSLTFVWNFGDSSAPYVGGPFANHVYSDSGSFQVVVQVMDGFGGSSHDTTTVFVTDNLRPVVDIRASEMSVIGICADSYEILLTVDHAEDADGTIVSYDWNFGDGSPHSNSDSSLFHVFPVPGTYFVTLTVVDNEGATGVDSVKIFLGRDFAPFAAFTASDDTVLVNQLVNFNASASNDHEGPIIGYHWDFGDGSVETATQPVISHAFGTLGDALVTLTVTDQCGNTSVVSKKLHVALSTGLTGFENLPSGFGLAQSFPNPVSLIDGGAAVTRIGFKLPAAADVHLSIYNIFGQQVRSLVHARHGAGEYTTAWDLRNDHGERVSTGIYFCRLQAAGRVAIRKLVISK